jgi:hypothetical protein
VESPGAEVAAEGPAARLVTQDNPATSMPQCRATIASGR